MTGKSFHPPVFSIFTLEGEIVDFKIKGVLVDVDVLESLDGRGWTFSRGTFRTGTQLHVAGRPGFYPTKEAAKTGAQIWAESMINQGLV